jgi:ATP-dependent Clp protease ATP-binding subunit ClpA
MDNGKLTDANGREVNFSNVILVMTSNVGAQTVSRASIETQQFHTHNAGKLFANLSFSNTCWTCK